MTLSLLNHFGPVEVEQPQVHPWHRSGPTYFVTLRLMDALSIQALCRLGEMRLKDPARAFAWLDRQLDEGSGGAILAEAANSLLIETTLMESDLGRYSLGPFVIMPNHVHILV